MEASNLQIYWHESQPIYSLCFQPHSSSSPKLITGGGDNKVRVWHLNFDQDHKTKIETIDILSSLTQHEQAINVVRFNSKGDVLASAGDDGQLLLWKQSEAKEKKFGEDEADLDEFNESWAVWKRFRSRGSGIGAYEIYDIAWSPNDDYIVTGSMDNAVRVFEVSTGECVASACDHSHYVQGVAWDPLDKYILSQSADRSVHVYEIVRESPDNESLQLKLKNKMMKCELPVSRKEENRLDLKNTKLSFIFHNETLPSFFRRPAISPCGKLICVPAGILKSESNAEGASSSEVNNVVQIYTRQAIEQNINKPTMCIPFLRKPALVVSFNPNLYELSESSKSYLQLPYKLVFAIATSNEVLIYDTESAEPIAAIGNLHYTSLTDLSWSQDGTLLMISSTDGFCSYISITPETLGQKLKNAGAGHILNEPSSKAESFPLKEQKKTDIVNILPIKRKLTSKAENPNKNMHVQNEKIIDEDGQASVTAQKEKRRVHPTLI